MLAQVENVLILKVKDIAIVAAKKIHFIPELQKLDTYDTYDSKRSLAGVPTRGKTRGYDTYTHIHCQVSSVYVILTNYVNWQRENLRSDRENTGNLKIQFEWVPWIYESCSITV